VKPKGYVETDGTATAHGASNRNAFENHPYLKIIKVRGGAFAILMAFDDQMRENFHAGRTYGAWKGNETLKKHGLIRVNSTEEYREGRGFRAQGKFTYDLREDGKLFTEALLDRHPAGRQETLFQYSTIFSVTASLATSNRLPFSFKTY